MFFQANDYIFCPIIENSPTKECWKNFEETAVRPGSIHFFNKGVDTKKGEGWIPYEHYKRQMGKQTLISM